ncbi:MAG: AI-2E family transporter [Planctomycetes bacterium]|nr:AI-2E family transporter [Planctomycetota bacterium]
MDKPRKKEAVRPPQPDGPPLLDINPQRFQRQLRIAALSVLLLVLSIHLLREFAAIFQPLLIAALLLYLIQPAHRWLVDHRVPSKLAHFLILVIVLGTLFGVGQLVYDSAEQLGKNWPGYEEKLDTVLLDVQKALPFVGGHLKGKRLRDLFQVSSLDEVLAPLRALVGTFIGFFSGLAVVALYLVFLTAERLTFAARLDRALGNNRADHVRGIMASINAAIARYLAVKALINLLVAVLTMLVLAVFGVPFVAMWGILTFLFNFIPYLGSVVATLAPLVVCLLEFSDRLWIVLVVAVLLVLIQQVLGVYLEPRLMGRRLGVSPLLILLSLSFWGVLWGVVGMILAVPLLMVFKIVLDNIPETRPIATLMSSE